MKARNWIALTAIWMGLSLTGNSVTSLRIDLASDDSPLKHSFSLEGLNFAVTGQISYNKSTQILQLSGVYQTNQLIEAGSFLSYQIYDNIGGLVLADGARFPWKKTESGALQAQLNTGVALDPGKQVLTIKFNAVVEGQYWYRDEHPEIEFPELVISGIPPRDHYLAILTYVPAVLPAQTLLRIPVWWKVGYRDIERSGFEGSSDARDALTQQRIESQRIPISATGRSTVGVLQWQTIEPLINGRALVRPGLVWDSVRWYNASSWFAYKKVRLISPLLYLCFAILATVAIQWVTGRTRTITRPALRWLTSIGVGTLAIWWGINLVISTYWVVVGGLGLISWLAHHTWKRDGRRIYAITFVFMALIEIYWGQMCGTHLVRESATIFAIAIWALLLLPLLIISSQTWRRGLATAVMTGWLFITTAGTFYYQFFQDYPSIETLLYVGQLSELSDSIYELGEQRHLIPPLVWGFTLVQLWKSTKATNAQCNDRAPF